MRSPAPTSCRASTRRAQSTRSRKGAVLVLVAVLMVVIIGFLALAVDFSRIYAQRNELHTAADAAALAGVIQLYQSPGLVSDTAISYGRNNTVLKKTLPAAGFTVVCGNWNDLANPESARFTVSGAGCTDASNAVRVRATDSTSYIFPNFLNVASKLLGVTSEAWMAYVSSSNCIKPWGIDYRLLTTKLDPSGDPLRTLTEADIYALNHMSVADLTFSLKFGDPQLPGNFGPIRIDGPGANNYEETITGCSSRMLGPDSLVWPGPGGQNGPTLQGLRVICDQIPNGQPNPGNPTAACYYTAPDGTVMFGYPVRTVLWLPEEVPPLGSSTPVRIKAIASFNLDSVGFDASIVGHWVAFEGNGTIGPTPGTIRRPILVR
jgi:Flp pilus assembly protein TadG